MDSASCGSYDGPGIHGVSLTGRLKSQGVIELLAAQVISLCVDRDPVKSSPGDVLEHVHDQSPADAAALKRFFHGQAGEVRTQRRGRADLVSDQLVFIFSNGRIG